MSAFIVLVITCVVGVHATKIGSIFSNEDLIIQVVSNGVRELETTDLQVIGQTCRGPTCNHTLTAVSPTKSHTPRLILFGGATTIGGGSSSTIPGIRNCHLLVLIGRRDND
ncbi:hypothetical protein L2E82_36174 [Cichorium intybus]|uniref:Uncharacterized protein n=1 Tax=Cichorium intybus TaxID=13427 RepID=A0ACB9BQX1_CICIN|nr:hypothetical protein L2E82_36174 [Cichorium intybus]